MHDEALRVRLLDEAGRLLTEQGPAGLSMRKLATDVGTSTTAVYSLFGSKSALVRAVFLEGFRRFGERLTAVEPDPDPRTHLLRLAHAYRESALADPHLYAVMFGRTFPEFEPAPGDRVASVATMDPLLDAVRAAQDRGLLVDAPANAVVMALWSQVHGLVSLELADCLPPGFDVGEHYAQVLQATLRGWLR